MEGAKPPPAAGGTGTPAGGGSGGGAPPVPAGASSSAPAQSIQWDPQALSNMRHRRPTPQMLRRLRKDIRNVLENPLPGVLVVPDEETNTIVHALIMGPADTPYEGGFFSFLLSFPDDYPTSPPRVKLMTTGGGTVRMNPNLYKNGKVCLSILGTWSGPGWLPSQSLSTVLLSIQSLLNEHPMTNEPGFETATQAEIQRHNDVIRHETLRVAVVDMVDPNSSMNQSLPEYFRESMKVVFAEAYENYQLVCEANRFRDGTERIDSFHDNRGVYQYGWISDRLREIYDGLPSELKPEEDEDEDEDDDDDEEDEDEDEDEEADDDDDEVENGEVPKDSSAAMPPAPP